MKILIDADGCPVVDITIKVAGKYKIRTMIICDTSHVFNKEGAETIVVSKGADSVDFKLVNMIEPGDIVITQDYGLAAMSLSRKAIPLRQDGLIYSDNNIDYLLNMRYISRKVRDSGGRFQSIPKRTTNDDISFQNSLESVLDGHNNL